MDANSENYTAMPSFDELLVMANERPDQLEILRQNMIKEIISKARPQSRKRLEGLQFQIDAQRSIAKTSLAACVKLSSMMMDSFEKMRQELPEAKKIAHFGLSVHACDNALTQETTQPDYVAAGHSNVVQFRR